MATIWAQITTIINAEPGVFAFNAILLVCEGISAGCVAAGIVWESTASTTWRRRVSHKFVIWGVVAEVLFSLVLFISDEIVSGAQLLKIGMLETRLAARTLKTADAAIIRDAAKKHPGQIFQIIPYWQDKESFDFAQQIASALISGGWTIDQPKRFTALLGVVAGIVVNADPAVPKVVEARKDLVDALNTLDLSATPDDSHPAANEPPDEKISISVGIKP